MTKILTNFLAFFFLVLCVTTALYYNRSRITYKLKEWCLKIRRNFGQPISLNDSFRDDLESGLSSHNFDIISQNDDDLRLGLDDNSKMEIKKLMQEENLTFDKARLVCMERKFGQNGIAPDGTPIDPRAVTFS